MILAGDVGGTKTYLAQFELADRGVGLPSGVEHFSSPRYPSLEAMIEEYARRHAVRFDAACFGVAGAVVKGRVRITNLPWSIDSGSVADQLGLKRVDLINDLVATGYGVTSLSPQALEVIQPGDPSDEANAAILAAGTGLGESILVRGNGDFLPIPSEGGHADFAPRTDPEIRIFQALRARHGRVSYERVVSGPGLAEVAEILHGERGDSATWTRHVSEAGEEGTAPVVSRLALEGACSACEEALRLFVGVYGAEAGNIALRAVARGGIYLGGGIAPRILPALKDGIFVEAFRDKDHLRPLLASIPIWVIRNERTALLGAARYASIRASSLAPNERADYTGRR